MRILQLSWEHPPVVHGGLGRHIHALAEAQATLGTTAPARQVRPLRPALLEGNLLAGDEELRRR